jgi:hypothetical protein
MHYWDDANGMVEKGAKRVWKSETKPLNLSWKSVLFLVKTYWKSVK